MFCTKYSKTSSKKPAAGVKKFESGGLVDQINRRGNKYDLGYEMEVRRSQLELDDPSRNRGQGPTKQNERNLKYRRELDERLAKRAKKSDD